MTPYSRVESSSDEANVEIKLDSMNLKVPADLSPDELNDYIWQRHSADIMASLSINRVQDTVKEKYDKRLQLLESVAHIQRQYLRSENMKQVFERILQDLLEFMGCEYGFIGELKVDEERQADYVQLHAATNIAWDDETRRFVEENEKRGGLRFYAFDNLFGTCVTTGKPVVCNDRESDPRSGGLPKGHPEVRQFLGLPFLGPEGKVLGMVAMANPRSGSFSEVDVDILQPFTVTCSNLIEAHWQIEENRNLINTLEKKVQKRTRELQKANVHLKDAHARVLAASQAQLRHFACMSHEIRTPLNCILGLSSLLQESDLDPGQKESVQMIVNSGDLLLTVVNDVLDYSKLETGNVEIEIAPFNLQTTLSSVVRSIEMKGKSKNLKVKPHFGEGIPEVITSDGRRLQQILYNLLGNAVKFSKDSGVIELGLSIVEGARQISDISSSTFRFELFSVGDDGSSTEELTVSDTKSVRSLASSKTGCPIPVEAASKGSCPFGFRPDVSNQSINEIPIRSVPPSKQRWLQLTVKDYGKGIEKDQLGIIFEPFRQAKAEKESVYGGTGLGLAITSRLVKALGGRISVESAFGEFSQFTVELPFSDESLALPSFNGETFVLIEDDEETVEYFCRITRGITASILSFPTLEAFGASLETQEILSACRRSSTVLIVKEELFDDDAFTRIEGCCKVLLASVGECFTVEKRQHQFLSLTAKLPSVLLQELKSLCAPQDQISSPPLSRKMPARGQSMRMSFYKDLRVLMVEDNLVNQKVLMRILKRLGVQNITVVDNGQKAVDIEAKESFDIIFMDNEMPVMNGVEACKRIVGRSDHPPPIVFVSAHVFKNFHQECAEAGAFSFISKPYSIADIENTLQRILGQD